MPLNYELLNSFLISYVISFLRLSPNFDSFSANNEFALSKCLFRNASFIFTHNDYLLLQRYILDKSFTPLRLLIKNVISLILIAFHLYHVENVTSLHT